MENSVVWIYIDDERRPPRDAAYVNRAVSYVQAIQLIETMESSEIAFVVDFDHDLGVGNSGYDVAKYIVAHQPKYLMGFAVHSMNPVGAENIRQLLSHYGYNEIPSLKN